MTPAEHIEGLCDFLDRCGYRARAEFKKGAGSYYDGHADGFFASALYLRELLTDMETDQNAHP